MVDDGDTARTLLAIEARRERARVRAARMRITRSAVGEEPHDAPVIGAEGIALQARLSAAAWSISGRPLPQPRTRPVVVSFLPRER